MHITRSKIRLKISLYKVFRTEGLTVRQAWEAAGEVIDYTNAMLQAMENLSGYDIMRLWHKPKR